MGGRGYSRGGRARGGGRNQQNGGGGRGPSPGANFNPFGTTQTNSYQNSGNTQSYSGRNSRDRKQDVPFQGRGSGRGQHHNQHSHHSRQVSSSSSSGPSNIFGYSNQSLDSMVNAAPRQHQHQGFNGNKSSLGHKTQHSFQKQSHFPTGINEMDMEDSSPNSGIFNNSAPASTNIFGQVNTAPSGSGIFGGHVATSSPFQPMHQQHQPTQTSHIGGGTSIFGTPLAPQSGSSGLSKPAAPVTPGLFGQNPKAQHGSSTLADFKQKQQQQLAQFSQMNATARSAPNATNVSRAASSAPNRSDSAFSADMKPVYSQDHFVEYGVPTLPPNTASVF